VESPAAEVTRLRDVVVKKERKTVKAKALYRQSISLAFLLLVIFIYKDKVLNLLLTSPATTAIIDPTTIEQVTTSKETEENIDLSGALIAPLKENRKDRLQGKSEEELDKLEYEILLKNGILKDSLASKSYYERRQRIVEVLATKIMSFEDYNILSSITYNKNVYRTMSLFRNNGHNNFKKHTICIGPAFSEADRLADSNATTFANIFFWENILGIENRLLYEDQIKTVKTIKFVSQNFDLEKIFQVIDKSNATLLLSFKQNISDKRQVVASFSSFSEEVGLAISSLEEKYKGHAILLVEKGDFSKVSSKILQITFTINIPSDLSSNLSFDSWNRHLDLMIDYEELIHGLLIEFLN